MSVTCQCASCKAKYQVGDQYAGHTIKCPKCSAAVVVPPVAQPVSPTAAAANGPSAAGATKTSAAVAAKAELPRARVVTRVEDPSAKPAATASSSPKIVKAVALSDTATVERDAGEDTAEVPPPDDGLGFLAGEPVPSARTAPGAKRRPEAAVAAQSPAKDGPGGDLASIAGLAARSSKGAVPHPVKKQKPALPSWAIPAIAAAGVAALVGIGVTIYVTLNSKSASEKAKPKNETAVASSSTTDSPKSNKTAKPGPKDPVLTIEWPENQRAGAWMTVNGEKRPVPQTGPIAIPVPPAKDQYRFVFQRPKFKPQTLNRVIPEDDKYALREWEPLDTGGLGWEQDYDAAKLKAGNDKKNVFILFDASDVKENSYASGRLKDAVVKRKEFHDRAEKDFICVYVDNPKNAEAQGEVQDAERNHKLTEKFKITVFPTVVVTDPKGRPFGVLEGYNVNGVTAFLALLDKWAADGKHFFGLFEKFKSMKEDSPDAELAGEVLDFLELSKLDRFYVGTMKKAVACLPKGERPVTKDAAEMWMRRLAMAARNSDEAKKVVEDFDHWKKTRTFKDKEAAAKLHLIAAIILARLDLRKEAVEKCKEGLAFQPHDPMVRATLQQASRFLSVEPGKPVLMPVGSGTGYCIAQGNYILTNHHVIHKAKEINVRLNGETDTYPAKLIGDSEAGDMALLKVELPAGKKLAPIPLMAKELRIGEDVCALGWGGAMSQSLNATFTKGVVSNLPAGDDNEDFIATDCMVNPGNSGGPLCSFCGGVAGMVTRKTAITSRETSIGMAIPVTRLRKFLVEKLPKDAQMPPAEAGKSANMKLVDLVDKIGPSVVYVENVQEIRTPKRGQQGQEPESESDSDSE